MVKSKRFFALILFAVACLFLVACGDEPVVGPKAPLELEIETAYSELDANACKLDGDDLELAIVEQEGFDTSVTWSSSDVAIATVDEDGAVHGVAPGRATITATSTANPDVKATYDMWVYGKSSQDMLQAASDWVKETMPKYILGGLDDSGKQVKTKLPSDYLTDFFEFKYTNVSDPSITYTNNRYYSTDAWNDRGIDSLDTIKCQISFKSGLLYTGSRNDIIQIKVVTDLVDNDFAAVEVFDNDFEEFFGDIDVAAYNIPSQVLNIRQSELLTVTWSTTDSAVLSVGIDEETGIYMVKYNKPHDDTMVKLTAIVVSASGAGSTHSIDVNCKGFSKQDKIDFFTNEICANLSALVGTRVSKDIKVPTNDATFEMAISWVSSDPEYLTASGKYTDHSTLGEPVDVAHPVTLTATIRYKAFDEYAQTEPWTSPNSFTEQVEFVIDVYPCTDSARAMNQIIAVNAHIGDQDADGNYLGWFPYGRLTRANDQLFVPSTMAEAGFSDSSHPEWDTAQISWVCSEEGLFDENWNLLKQYLRYHAVSLVGTVQLGSATETVEIILNVGLAQFENTIHCGGSFSRLAVQTSELTAIAMDSLSTLSGFDETVGKYQDYYKGDKTSEWYTQIMQAKEDLSGSEYIVPDYDAYQVKPVTVDKAFALGFTSGFGGVTLSWINPDTNTPYVWYACEAFTWIITDDDVNDDGTIKTKWVKQVQQGTSYIWQECSESEADYQVIPSLAGRYNKQYDGMVVVNASSKIVKFPMIDHDGASDALYPKTKQGRIGYSSGFEAGAVLGVYGGDPCSIIGKNGIVGFHADENPELDQTKFNGTFAALASGNDSGEICVTINFEPGAVLMDCCEGQDASYTDAGGISGGTSAKDVSLTGLCTAGTQVQVEFWKIHACNTVTCTDRYTDGEFGQNINIWANVISESSSIDVDVNEARK